MYFIAKFVTCIQANINL